MVALALPRRALQRETPAPPPAARSDTIPSTRHADIPPGWRWPRCHGRPLPKARRIAVAAEAQPPVYPTGWTCIPSGVNPRPARVADFPRGSHPPGPPPVSRMVPTPATAEIMPCAGRCRLDRSVAPFTWLGGGRIPGIQRSPSRNPGRQHQTRRQRRHLKERKQSSCVW